MVFSILFFFWGVGGAAQTCTHYFIIWVSEWHESIHCNTLLLCSARKLACSHDQHLQSHPEVHTPSSVFHPNSCHLSRSPHFFRFSSNTYCGWKTVGATEQTQPAKSKPVHGCLKLCFLRQCTTVLHLPQPVISNHIHNYIVLLSVILWNYSLKPKARRFLGGKIKEQWNDVSRSQRKTDARGGKLWQHNSDYHCCYSVHQLSVRIQMSKEKKEKNQLRCICLPVREQRSVSALCGIPAKVTSCACCQTAASAECSLLGDNWNVACKYLITV